MIPLKSFAHAKGRLAETLSPAERAGLARRCAGAVVAAADEWPVYVSTGDDEVAAWASERNLVVVRSTGGLDVAVADAVAAAADDGAAHVVVAHGDLPLARSFASVPVAGSVSAVGDRRGDGTNVLSFPTGSAMTTAYGPGSLARHRALAREAGLDWVEVDDPDLALDLDTADDLDELRRRTPSATGTQPEATR